MATLVSRNEFNVYESADARFEAAARKLNLRGTVPLSEVPEQGNHRVHSGDARQRPLGGVCRLSRPSFDCARAGQGRNPLAPNVTLDEVRALAS